MKIKIKDIVVTGENPREHFDEEKLRELGESIKVKGLLQSIIVRPRDGRYELVVGERRFKAHQLVGIPEIEAEVKDIDDLTCMDLRLVENIHSEDLTPLEKDKAYADYLMSIARERGYDLSDDEQYHRLIDEASGRTGIRKDVFRVRLKTMGLSEILKNTGISVPHGVAREIAKHSSLGVTKQVRIAKKAQEMELTRGETRKCLENIHQKPNEELDKTIEKTTSKARRLRERQKKEKRALKEKMKKEKARKPKKKSGRPRKKIKPNEILEKLAAKKRKKIEEIGEKAKESAIKREISALAKKREKPSPPQVQIEGIPETKHMIVLKDSREMHELRDGSVHLMITSPPYFNAPFDYRDHFESYDSGDESFLPLIRKSAEEIYRVLQEGRVVCINCDDMLVNGKKYPIVADVTKIFQETGFKYRDKLIWRKPEGYIRISRRSGIILQHPYPMYYYPDNIQESVLIFQKGNFDHKGIEIEKKDKQLSRIDIKEFQDKKWNLSVWDIMNVSPSQSRLEKSIAAFPEELVRRLIILFSHVGETVLDPFLGSGTTTKVAYELGRNSVGYEVDKKLLKVIRRKVGITKENKHQFEILGI